MKPSQADCTRIRKAAAEHCGISEQRISLAPQRINTCSWEAFRKTTDTDGLWSFGIHERGLGGRYLGYVRFSCINGKWSIEHGT